jgi:hypothetical protein
MRRFLQVYIFCVVLGSITSLRAGPVEDLVVYINQSAGVDAGMALVLDDRDGQLTAAMAQSNRLTVQGSTWDAATVQPSRQVVQAAGVGHRATIALLETNRLPYVENLINLVVSASWGRQSIDIADVLFVLAPGGIGVIGNDGNPSAISGLSNTLSQAGVTDITVLSREGWLKFIKPANTNMGTWTHNLAGADLSAVSGDKIAGPWSEIRWVGDPRWGSFYLTYLGRVTEAGRLYYQEKRSIKDGKHQIWIVGRDAWNGAELWRFTNGNPVTNAFPSYWDGTLCCDSQQVYFTEDKVLVARDGRTGAKVRNYAPGFIPNPSLPVRG